VNKQKIYVYENGSALTEKNTCNKISVKHNICSQSHTQAVCFELIN